MRRRQLLVFTGSAVLGGLSRGLTSDSAVGFTDERIGVCTSSDSTPQPSMECTG